MNNYGHRNSFFFWIPKDIDSAATNITTTIEFVKKKFVEEYLDVSEKLFSNYYKLHNFFIFDGNYLSLSCNQH